ncbi:hypothetical protein M9H77_12206 [Catharanthus roseus]|uniref:Uncharacterized protein n=1 Tax=Catharanthus roseus TaxID=4058 RepID=A0ACC0BGR8_CATRO|nr:hypothetical protein M9H77_12206 [Catharanthus roseus]
MRVSSAAGSLSELRHTSAASTPKFKRTCNATVELHGQSSDPQNEVIGTKFRHLVVNTSQTPYERSITKGLPWDQPQFRAPPDSPLGGRTPPKNMMGCPRRLNGPHPPRSMPHFKWIYSSESETSAPLEEALIRGTSHIQCNPLTLPNTRS